MLNLPFMVELLGKILNLIIGIAGSDADVLRVFNSLIAFFGG